MIRKFYFVGLGCWLISYIRFAYQNLTRFKYTNFFFFLVFIQSKSSKLLQADKMILTHKLSHHFNEKFYKMPLLWLHLAGIPYVGSSMVNLILSLTHTHSSCFRTYHNLTLVHALDTIGFY